LIRGIFRRFLRSPSFINMVKSFMMEEDRERLLRKALEEFRDEVLKIKGVVGVIIPDEEFYESNVLVILSKIDREILERIMKIKFLIEDRYKEEIMISPYIALEGEDIVSKIEETSRGGYKRS